MIKRIAAAVTLLLLTIQLNVNAQNNPVVIPGVMYEVGGITVSGTENLDKNVVILLSGIAVGDKITIPGDELAKAVKALWKQKLFADISITVTEKQGNLVFLNIHLQELPKLSKFYFTGIKNSWKDDLREELQLSSSKTIVTENMLIISKNKIKQYFNEKGYRKAEIDIVQTIDSARGNRVILGFRIDVGPRVKINEINFYGNDNVPDKLLIKAMEETRERGLKSIFKSSKLRRAEYEADKRAVISKFNELGYRDARILRDSIYDVADGLINVDVYIEEGNKYFFRDITFLGNTKYSTDVLRTVLRIEKGDVYDSKLLNERVSLDMDGNDIASIYLNNGYLFSQVIPVETQVSNDSIDIEIRIREGRQATVANVSVTGNDRTNDHVVYRELRTRPGDLFSKAEIQRTIRELAQLGYFDQQSLNVNPKPDPETGTVDLEYTVTERSTSQLELQGGWGGGYIIGTLGLSFNNFSARNILNTDAWTPLPSGDGQTINLRAQSNGRYFQSYSFSFTEPWLGGKKPTSLTFSVYHNVQTNGVPKGDIRRQQLQITGVNVGLGKRLKWPDDYFTLYQGLEYRRFNMNNYNTSFLSFTNGISHNINYKINLSRNSTDVPIFPTRGSQFSAELEITPPFSLFSNQDYTTVDDAEKYKWIEYHKWKFSADWFTPIAFNNKLVFRAHAEFGFLGYFNDDIGLPPFEHFYLGGDGLTNFVIDGREIVGLRGYPNQSIPDGPGGSSGPGASHYNKFILEGRFLISPNPNAMIFALGFVEGGHATLGARDFRPFEMKRSAGGGIRIFMPMFGLLGFDVGYGFDNIPKTVGPSGWQTHFIIGQQF